jgi:hypothetical protein
MCLALSASLFPDYPSLITEYYETAGIYPKKQKLIARNREKLLQASSGMTLLLLLLTLS